MSEIDQYDDGGPGRPRTVRRPSRRTRARIERHRDALEAHEGGDAVIQAARRREKLEALYIVREQISIEASSLLFERLNARPGSRELGRISSRRVAALAEVGRLTIEIARADPGAPSAALVRRVCGLLQAEIEEAASQVFDQATVTRFVTALRQHIEGSALDELIDRR